MTPLHARRRPARRGAAAIEAALVLPVLLAILFGIMDWSWYLFHQMSVTVAAERGVRIAAGVAPDADPAGRAEAAARASLEAHGLRSGDVAVTTTLGAGAAGQTVSVAVELPFDPLIGLVPAPEVLRGQAEGPWYAHLFAGAGGGGA